MKARQFFTSLAAAVMLTASAHASYSTDSSAQAGAMMTFRNAEYRFTVELPDTWDLQQGYAEGTLDFVMIALSPDEGPSDSFVENMNILVDDIGYAMTSEQYFEQNLRGVQNDLPNVELTDKRRVNINGTEMYKATYTWQGETSRITTYQFIFVEANKGYVITFTTEPNSFRRYRPIFDDIVKTFAFNP